MTIKEAISILNVVLTKTDNEEVKTAVQNSITLLNNLGKDTLANESGEDFALPQNIEKLIDGMNSAVPSRQVNLAWAQQLDRAIQCDFVKENRNAVNKAIDWETISKWTAIVFAIFTLLVGFLALYFRMGYDEIAFWGTIGGAIITLAIAAIAGICNYILKKRFRGKYNISIDKARNLIGTEEDIEAVEDRNNERTEEEKTKDDKKSLLPALFFTLIAFVGAVFLLMVVISLLEHCPVLIPEWLNGFIKILNPIAFWVGLLGLSTFGFLTWRKDVDFGKYLIFGSLVFFTSWGIIWLCDNYIFVSGWTLAVLIILSVIDLAGGVELLGLSWKSHIFTCGSSHKMAQKSLAVVEAVLCVALAVKVSLLLLGARLGTFDEKGFYLIAIVLFSICSALLLVVSVWRMVTGENRRFHFFRDLIMIGFWVSLAFSAVTLLISGFAFDMYTDGNFEYIENQDGTLSFVTTLYKNYDTIEIPSEVNGKPVTSIVFGGFSYVRHSARVVIIPDSIVKIDDDAFYYYRFLESIIVSEDNEVYSSKDGILYDKDGKNVIIDPQKIKENITGVSWNNYRQVMWGYKKRNQFQ